MVTGAYFVRKTPFAMDDAHELCRGDIRELFKLRRQALKLRFWPGERDNQVMDLDWCWVQALRGKNVGELRIHENIAGHDNLRVFFWVGEQRAGDILPNIWLLMAMQKKSNDILKGTLLTLDIRRKTVFKRSYS